MKKLILLLGLLVPALAGAQSYSIGWYRIASGGGTSTNGALRVTGTIGQPDASGTMTGGGFSLTGGFWSIYAVQTAGLPILSISLTGTNSVTVSWPNTGSYILQTNSILSNGSWAAGGYTVNTVNGINSVTITPQAGSMFFRLQSQ
jgi:hypothetical protein